MLCGLQGSAARPLRVRGADGALHDVNEDSVQTDAEEKLFGMIRGVKPNHRDLPRNVADEGFYEPPAPSVASWNLDTIRSRCLREDPQQAHFFRPQDRSFIVAPLPTELTPVRPQPLPLFLDPEQISTLNAATVRYLPAKHMGTTQYYDFKIHLRELSLTDHPLLSKEDLLCLELERDYQEYQRRRAINLIKYYSTRLETLRAQSRRLLEQLNALSNPAYVPPGYLAPNAPPTAVASSSPEPFTSVARAQLTLQLVTRLVHVLTEILHMREERDLEDGEQRKLFQQVETDRVLSGCCVVPTLCRDSSSCGHLNIQLDCAVLCLCQMYETWLHVRRWREAEALRLNLPSDAHQFNESTHAKHSDAADSTVAAGGASTGSAPGVTGSEESDAQVGKGSIGTVLSSTSAASSTSRAPMFVGNPVRLLVEADVPDAAAAALEEDAWQNAIQEELYDRRLLRQMQEKQLLCMRDEAGAQALSAWDEPWVRTAVVGRRETHARLPGRPRYTPVLDRRLSLTDRSRCDHREQERRDAIAETRLCAHVYVNGNFLERTPYHSLQFPHLGLALDATFHLRLLRVPDEVRVEVRPSLMLMRPVHVRAVFFCFCSVLSLLVLLLAESKSRGVC